MGNGAYEAFANGDEPMPEKKPLRGNLIRLIFDSRTCIRAMIALLLVAACVAVNIHSWKIAKSNSFLEMPLPKKIAERYEENKAQRVEKITEAYQNAISQHSQELQEKLTPQEYQLVEDFSQVLKDCAGNLSAANTEKLTESFHQVQDLLTEKSNILPKDYLNVFKEGARSLLGLDKLLNFYHSVLYTVMAICVVLCLCGGFFRLRGLIGLSLSLSILYNLLFVSFGMLMLSVVAHVALQIVLRKLKRQCKKSQN